MAQNRTRLLLWLCVTVLLTGGCKEEPRSSPPEPNTAAQPQPDPSPAKDQNTPAGQQTSEPNRPAQVPASPGLADGPRIRPKPTLSGIIARRRGWGPAYTNWAGKEAPDFTVRDIYGKQHTLSQYRGRNVMVVFWATWCGPCRMEIPNLIELRKTFSENDLAILAISYSSPMEPTEKVRKFVAANPVINYTVISTNGENMPRPYNLVTGIPCTFFLDPQGKIKLATEGVISLSQLKAILEAES